MKHFAFSCERKHQVLMESWNHTRGKLQVLLDASDTFGYTCKEKLTSLYGKTSVLSAQKKAAGHCEKHCGCTCAQNVWIMADTLRFHVHRNSLCIELCTMNTLGRPCIRSCCETTATLKLVPHPQRKMPGCQVNNLMLPTLSGWNFLGEILINVNKSLSYKMGTSNFLL